MTISQIEAMFPPLEWRQTDPAHPYPLECHIGNAVTTITEDHTVGQPPVYNVTWEDGSRSYVVRNVQPVLVKSSAEFQARLLFQKLNRQPRNAAKGKRS